MLDQLKQIAIIGPGLLGASMGLALKARGYRGRIVGVSRRPATAARARELGCIDQAVGGVAEAAEVSNLAVIAAPLSAFEAIFQQLATVANDSLIVSDVGSTKRSVVDLANQYLPAPGRFVGAHPMAGSEQQGPDAACADLFEGKPCILTPKDNTDEQAIKTVEQLWRALGMRVLHLSADEHDAQTAVISHLPHAAAVMLVQAAQKQGGWALASTGFRDTTRLASSNPSMRADILAANRAAVLTSLEGLHGEIEVLMQRLQAGDDAAVLDWLDQAKQARDKWLNDKG